MILKRMLDVVISALLLVMLAPALLVIAIAIRIDSPGPAIFRQQRWGWKERPFWFYKFRSMDVAPRPTTRALGAGELEKGPNDLRVTRVGAFLRRTSLDELPQLWNVLRGDMSLVGPRPLMLHMLAPYPELRATRCAVRPGITGLWQVNDREHNTHVSFMAEWDLEYVQRRSLALDFAILWRTVSVVLSRRGAV